MSKRLTVAGVVGVIAIACAVPLANGATGISAHMTGNQIVNPNGGDPDGSANISLRVNRVKARVCYTLSYKNLEKITGAFIHKGGAGQIARPIITLFEGNVSSPDSGCVHDLKKKLVKRLKRKPEGHYVDVTTKEYPDGAVRGQLE
jgi:hypothetical protein